MTTFFKYLSLLIIAFAILVAIFYPEHRIIFLIDAAIWVMVYHSVITYEK